MEIELVRAITYWVAIIVLTGVLIWGLRLVSLELKKTDADGRSLLTKALSEKPGPVVDRDGNPMTTRMTIVRGARGQLTGGGDPGRVEETESKDVLITFPVSGSFSRFAGAMGAIGMSAFYIGLGYWILAALIYEEPLKEPLKNLSEIWPYILSGVALFFPYAFNKLSKIFGSNT